MGQNTNYCSWKEGKKVNECRIKYNRNYNNKHNNNAMDIIKICF